MQNKGPGFPSIPLTLGLGTFLLSSSRWWWCQVSQKDPVQLPDSTTWGSELSLRWPRRQSWAKGSWWASDDSSWKKKILVVDKHTLKRISKTLQFPKHYCYLKSLLKIFCRCIYSIIYIVDKNTGFSEVVKMDENWVNAGSMDCTDNL